MISVIPTTDEHIGDLWRIVSGFPEFFAESDSIKTEEEFGLWFRSTAVSPLTSLVDNGVIGCGYLDEVYEGYWGSVNIFKRPGSGHPLDVKEACRGALSYWMEKYRLEKLIGVIRHDNRPCLVLAKIIGFSTDGVLRHHKLVNGKWTDYILTSILRGEL